MQSELAGAERIATTRSCATRRVYICTRVRDTREKTDISILRENNDKRLRDYVLGLDGGAIV